MKKKYTAWTDLRQSVEQVTKEFNLYENFKSVNITEIDNINEKFQKHFVKSRYETAYSSWWIWEKLKDEVQWGKHCSDYKATNEIIEYAINNKDDTFYLILTETYKEQMKFWYYEAKIREILTIVGETEGIDEFYIFSKKYEWLIGQNHHDCIFSAGIEKTERLKEAFKIYEQKNISKK